MNTTTLDETRTQDELALEAANHALTMWLYEHPECASDYDAFNVSQDAMRQLAAGNPEVETYLLLTDVRQWLRTLTGRSWE